MEPPKRITQELGKTGNSYAWLNRYMVDWGDGQPRETFLPQTPDGAFALPLLPSGNVLLVRQYRVFLERWTLEVPGGIIDHGETPAEAALREVEEEAGHRAGGLLSLSAYNLGPGTRGRCHLFVAQDLRKTAQRPDRDEGELTVIELSPDELWSKILSGEIDDSPTLICVLFAKERGLLRLNTTK